MVDAWQPSQQLPRWPGPPQLPRRPDPPQTSLEISIRRTLRVYPRRYLEARADELFDLVRDLLGPDAQAVPLRIRLDLVRGALLVRRRDRPPRRYRMAYLWFDRRLPAQWELWVRDDIGSSGFLLRRCRSVLWGSGIGWLIAHIFLHPMPVTPWLVGAAVGSAIGSVATQAKSRSRARRRHGIAEP
jgi:hypothetical protein